MSFCCVVFRFRPQHGYVVGKYRFGTIGEWGKLFCAYKLSKLSGAKWYSSHCWCEMCVCVLRGCLSVMRGITFGEGNAGHIKCESMNTNNTNWGLMRTQTCLSPASTAPEKKKKSKLTASFNKNVLIGVCQGRGSRAYEALSFSARKFVIHTTIFCLYLAVPQSSHFI